MAGANLIVKEDIWEENGERRKAAFHYSGTVKSDERFGTLAPHIVKEQAT